MDAFTLVAKLVLNREEYDKEMENVEKDGDSGASSTGKKVAQAGKAAASAVADFLKAATQTGMTFDAMMSKVQALSGAEGAQFDALRDKAQELGLTTKFTATEVAEAMGYMGMAGWKTQDMLDGIEGVMMLAAASGEDLAGVSDIVTDSLTAFGLTAKDTQHYVDVLAATATNSNTSISDMGYAFKYVAPLAGQLGYSIDDISVAMGIMANSGIKGSMAGTTLRNILQHLISPTEGQAQAMEALGISLTDSNGRIKTFAEVMGDMRGAAEKSGFDIKQLSEDIGKLDKQLEAGTITEDEYNSKVQELTAGNMDFLAAVTELAGARGLSGFLAIMNATEGDFSKLQSVIDKSSGAAGRMAKTMNDNLQGDITLLNSAIEGLKLLISDNYSEQLRTFVQSLTGGLSELGKILKYGFGDQEVNALGQAFEGADQRADEATKNAVRNELTAKSLYEQLVQMGEGARLSGEDLAVWQGAASQLIALCPSLADKIDMTTGSFTASKEAIYADIEALTARTKVMALEQAMSEKTAALVKAQSEEIDRRADVLVKESQLKADTKTAVDEANAMLARFGASYEYNGETKTTVSTLEEAAHAAAALEQIAQETGNQEMADALNDLTGYVDKMINSKTALDEARTAQENMTSAVAAAQAEYTAYCTAVQSMIAEITGLGEAIDGLPNQKTIDIDVNTNTNSGGDDGVPKASGAWMIPYDNYKAILHRGERVLTASQTRQMDRGLASPVSSSAIASAMRSAVMDLTMELDGDTVGRVFGNRTTARVNNNISQINRRHRYGYGG